MTASVPPDEAFNEPFAISTIAAKRLGRHLLARPQT